MAGGNFALQYWNASTGNAWLTLGHSRGATPGTHSALIANDYLGGISFEGSDGTAFQTGAAIKSKNTTTPTSGHVPSDIEFLTDSGAGLGIRVLIDQAGNFEPISNNSYTLGTSSLGWSHVYAVDGAFATLEATGNLFGTLAVATQDTGRRGTDGLRFRNSTSGHSSYLEIMPNGSGASGLEFYNADDVTGTNLGRVTFAISNNATTFTVTPTGYGSGTAPTLFNVAMNQSVTGTNTSTGHTSESTSNTPSIASGACGTGTNGSIAGTDQDGTITIGASATTACAIVFGSSTWVTGPNACVFSPRNAGAAAITTLAYVSALSASGWTLTGSVLASTTWGYHCQ
jgi:hypothetical protein